MPTKLPSVWIQTCLQLHRGQDFRRPELRREVFCRFYQFHLKYRAHPGCVYYLIPYLRRKLRWSREEALWFAFLNGNTQHPVTSFVLHRRFRSLAQADELLGFYKQNYARLAFDADRRHHKKSLPEAISSYASLLGKAPQAEMWDTAANYGFWAVWDLARRIHSFGRLSAFSFCEYLRIVDVDVDCESLMLADHAGSRSHRNGLCKVLGFDSLDWHSSNPDFDGHYSGDLIEALERQGHSLLLEAKRRAAGTDYQRDVSYFTLESALCTFKSWFRANRRYPNVYNDMLYDRIRKAQDVWPDDDLSLFWDARRHYLPPHLRLEDSPHDPGCVPVKQNHFRLTGEVVMMQHDWPEFSNAFNDAIESHRLPVRR